MDKMVGDSEVKITKIGEDGTETVEFKGNTFLNNGIKYIWDRVCSDSKTALTTSASIGVGDGTTSVDPTQTSLQGANTYYQEIESDYPIYGDTTHITVRANFDVDVANFEWNEICVVSDDDLINRMVKDFGTKTDDEAWIVDVNLILE